jgi:hypothetical protein
LSTPEAARKEPVPAAFFLWKAGFAAFISGSLHFRVSPAVVGAPEVPAGALGDEFADLGYEGHAQGALVCRFGLPFLLGVSLLQFIEEFFHFHGRWPGTVAVVSGQLVGGDHEVVDGPCDSHGPCGVFLLLLGEAERDDDSCRAVAVGAG